MSDRVGRTVLLGLFIVAVVLVVVTAVRGNGALWVVALIIAALVLGLFYIAFTVGTSASNEVRPDIAEALTNLGGDVRNKQRVNVTLADGRTVSDIGFAYHRYRELPFGRRRYRGWSAYDVTEVRPLVTDDSQRTGPH